MILILHGVQGAAKSTVARVFRSLTDPSRSPLRGEPRDQQELLITARNNWVVAVDNVSHLQPWLSDSLCRLSTGGGLGKRQLYTDQDEIVLDAQRPLVLTGITEIATRGDLADRAIIVEQLAIDDSGRRSEDEFWRAFEGVRPQILGALFDAVASAVANEASVVLDRLPRMADPTRWVTAAEPALGWRPGTFHEAYDRNRHEGQVIALEASPIAEPLQELARRGEWVGSAADLLRELVGIATEATTRDREWPKNPAALTASLKRLDPSLRAAGIEWLRLPRKGSTRPQSIRAIVGAPVTTVRTAGRAIDRDTDDGRDRQAQAHTPNVDLLADAIRIFGGDIESMGGRA